MKLRIKSEKKVLKVISKTFQSWTTTNSPTHCHANHPISVSCEFVLRHLVVGLLTNAAARTINKAKKTPKFCSITQSFLIRRLILYNNVQLLIILTTARLKLSPMITTTTYFQSVLEHNNSDKISKMAKGRTSKAITEESIARLLLL